MSVITNHGCDVQKVDELSSDLGLAENLLQERIEAQIFLDLAIEDYESESLEA